jgi:hypothetical protein
MEGAGLTESISEERTEKRTSARQAHNIKSKPKNNRERLSDLFDKEWNNIMLKLKKATFTAAYINGLFAGPTQTISEPMQLLQTIIQDEYKHQIKPRSPIHTEAPTKENPAKEAPKGYDEELMEVE